MSRDKGTYNRFFDVLPYAMVDGINAAGVYCGMNAVPKNDIQNIDINPDGADDVCTMMLVRYILDNCDNIDDIEYYIHDAHIFGTDYLPGMNVHLFLANRYKSYCVELEEDHIDVNSYPILSNFRTNRGFDITSRRIRDYHADWSTVEANGAGLERWDICAQFLKDKSGNFDKLTDDLKFSRSYTDIDETEKDTWFTDSGGCDGIQMDVMCAKDCHDNKTQSQYYSQFMDLMQQRNLEFSQRKRKERNTQHTVHSALYDLKNLKVQLQIQENNDQTWEISL